MSVPLIMLLAPFDQETPAIPDGTTIGSGMATPLECLTSIQKHYVPIIPSISP
ncbi:hypothetical protein [Fodinibius salinus]|uniref:hypothetical protein n=1 Tax=Fodinibius salinus TaxID=860790 RepID=UPI001478104A|nr:hypothetical protein [Fodinibius salinus]